MIVHLLHIAVGVALVLLAWLIPRHIAGARWDRPAAVLLDAAPFILGAALLLLATGRPVFTGLLALALGAGFALADATMRDALREPALFTAAAEFPQVFTHPHLYLPFAGTGTVLGGAIAALCTGLGLLLFEPAAWPAHPAMALAAAAGLALAAWMTGREPALAAAALRLRALRPTGEPFADAAALGPFAMLIAHGTIARAERAARRARYPVPSLAGRRRGPGGPLVLVQCESFFDARRLLPQLPCDLLPGFDHCCAGGGGFGRLDVAGWGANTMRAEFAVLSGIPDEALGYDRFNPYYAFARVPIASQVWRLRAAGYRTICVHPFDRRFFRRDLAMPALGFETFLCRRSLGGGRRPPYHSDPDLARQILELLDESGPDTFIFAITMGNHGPWLAGVEPADPDLAASIGAEALPQGREFLRYLDGLRRSDEMLGILADGLDRRRDGTVLGFYGDHLPSLPRLYAHLGFDEWASDYVIRHPGQPAALGVELPAHQLGKTLVDAVLGRSIRAVA